MSALEKHYSVGEVAELWKISPDTVRKLFAHRSDVLKIGASHPRKRKYVTLRIPESALLRAYNDLREVTRG